MSATESGGRRLAGILTLATLIGAGASSVASGAEVSRYDYQGAASICQAATAQYAPSVRSRPLALVNEGTSDAFVACALRGDPRPQGRGAMKLLVEVGAPGARSAAVSCTFVEGYQRGSTIDAVYRTKSTIVSAGARGQALTWQPSEIAGSPEHIFRPAVQCMLGPGAALHYLTVTYDEDIGS